MREAAFKSWLAANYTANSAATHRSQARKVEEAYGDLDVIFDDGAIEQVASELNYSSQDAKAGRPNPSKIQQAGTNLHANLGAYKSSLRCYAKFRENESEIITEVAIEIAGQAIKEKNDGKQFELERNLQAALRGEIAQLEAGLVIIDGGQERSVPSGFIDILAKDGAGALVVIELKAGQGKRDALGQILGYMGDLRSEEPGSIVRGILVAASFDQSCRSARAVTPLVELREYRFSFNFVTPD